MKFINRYLNMPIVRASVFFGLCVVVITSITFAIDFYWLQGSLPGYDILAYPGIVSLRLFSEELGFSQKMLILLCSQFLFYACLFGLLKTSCLSLRRARRQKMNS